MRSGIEPGSFLIREFRPVAEDAAAATAILREANEAAHWPEESLLGGSFDTSSSFAFFAEQAGKPTGFIIGRQVDDEGELLNLAITLRFRRQGQGMALVNALFRVFQSKAVTRVFLEVRESNATAICFYEKLGFKRMGKRTGYYQHPPEAALVYEKHL